MSRKSITSSCLIAALRRSTFGCVLTDDPTTNRFRIPNGTTIPPRGLLAFNQNQLGFRLDAAGESLFLIHSNLTRVLDAVRFGPQENGIASGRYPDGSPAFRPLSNPTPGAENEMFRITGSDQEICTIQFRKQRDEFSNCTPLATRLTCRVSIRTA